MTRVFITGSADGLGRAAAQRLVYLSSSMHRGGRAEVNAMDWSGRATTGSYSDSKLFVTTLALAVARLWPDVLSNVVDPDGCPRRWAAPAPGEQPFQDELLDALARFTATPLATHQPEENSCAEQ